MPPILLPISTIQIDWNKLDRFGRVIGKVMVNGQDVNLEQIRRGCAWHYRQYQGERSPDDRVSYAQAEDGARASRVRLWGDSGAVAPWEWRHRSK